MILFVDDEPQALELYIDEVSRKGFETKLLSSVRGIQRYLKRHGNPPQCIVLDIMFPTDRTLPVELTSGGLTAGVPLFASLRAEFPDVPIVVFTSSSSLAVKHFFRDQKSCSFYYKTDLLPSELADIVAGLAEDRGTHLLQELESCPPGRRYAKRFEVLCVRVIEYLFVPPLQRVIFQARRADGHVIRDAMIPNNASSFFWSSLRSELDAKHIVVEFKNLSKPVGKGEVLQLREYLARKSVGRFGLLISRLPPSPSALQAQRDAYGDQDCLIIFLADGNLQEMLELRSQGADPTSILERKKEEFELAY